MACELNPRHFSQLVLGESTGDVRESTPTLVSIGHDSDPNGLSGTMAGYLGTHVHFIAILRLTCPLDSRRSAPARRATRHVATEPIGI